MPKLPKISDKALVIACAVGAVAAAVIFVWRFHENEPGDPLDWAGFATYFSGIVGPIVGLATALLVVRTLTVTRSEADLTRNEMREQSEHLKAQVDLLKRELALNEMQKRLDGVLVQWDRLLDAMAPKEVTDTFGGSFGSVTLRDVFHESSFPRLMDTLATNRGQTFSRHWHNFFVEEIALLHELDEYCREYDNLAGNRTLTDYYRRRVRRVVWAFDNGRLIQKPLVNSFSVTAHGGWFVVADGTGAPSAVVDAAHVVPAAFSASEPKP